ncbi:unnamed protein product [Rhizophagus irregularis]|uniref:Uncharacterized protein n=1 Tax=Rhizophagus irregularis TaxID=588596 RepID=A0A915YVR3_9GLOM|nr:unnamed protein product [Rhizophagus irregularis]
MSIGIDSLPIENWDTDALIAFLRRQDLKFHDDDFEILRREKITGLKEVLKEYDRTYPFKDDDDDEELQQSEKKLKIFKSEQRSKNNNTSATSIAYFPIDERLAFISGTTEGICKISSVDPRLSSVSLYCEYKLGKTYIYQPQNFIGYPITLKSPFSSLEKIITALDRSKTKLVDNINYVIEFVELPDCAEVVKSSHNTSASTKLTKTVMTQTKSYDEDTKALTYIAKGIMFKSISWFTWNEQEAFRIGKKKGILRLVSADPRLTGVTLTCNYQLSNALFNFQGDIGYPMIVDCSYGSIKSVLTRDKKKIMDNHNYKLTFLS